MLHPDYPIVSGRYQMTREWAVTLPGEFNRRFEDNALVFWRPGLTAWTIVWNNDNAKSQADRLKGLRSDVSPEAYDAEVLTEDAITRYAYRMSEHGDDGVVHSINAFAIGADGHVQMAVYIDTEDELADARRIWTSLEETPGA